MDTIRDMLSVGEHGDGWAIWRWDSYDSRLVATFPREDEAWGVTQLILEYVESFGHTPDYAISLALNVYKMALHGIWRADTIAAAPPHPDELAYQDHAHLMGYVG
jgi:hypothetical protein